MKSAIPTALVALCLAGCASAGLSSDEPDDVFSDVFNGVPKERSDRIAATLAGRPLGDARNPVRVSMPVGERAYLSRLRCANGAAPDFQRQGSTGIGPYGQVLDVYDVRCSGSEPANSLVYMDMYHPTHIETAAPPGFTLVP